MTPPTDPSTKGSGGPTADHHPADDGHTFRLVVTSRMASKVVGDAHNTDADWWGPPLVYEVRAFDLPQALRVASTVPVASWFEGGREEALASARARGVAVELENQVAAALALHRPAAGVLCPTCVARHDPCPTARALGATLLDDDDASQRDPALNPQYGEPYYGSH